MRVGNSNAFAPTEDSVRKRLERDQKSLEYNIIFQNVPDRELTVTDRTTQINLSMKVLSKSQA